ncbi:unnamed protein product [Peronospora belbahrii]|uniref:Uncharacterized protein n=1 Tax=Peronospora belbahrii TaxID=622444 RepID=A0AAU9LE86_9STRA|nr:unnamed protein product [Peronospora belbahrii]CAH0519143.1 unnamed protein product [Peronospora belbahrii]
MLPLVNAHVAVTSSGTVYLLPAHASSHGMAASYICARDYSPSTLKMRPSPTAVPSSALSCRRDTGKLRKIRAVRWRHLLSQRTPSRN